MRSRLGVPGGALGGALAVLVLSLFAAGVAHHWFLGDDGYICFRYARNLLDGHGLVYNPGERVEGYTTFLWTMLMAGAMAMGLAPELTANAIGTASGAAILALLVAFSLRRGAGPWAFAAPLALAVNRTFTAWSTGGLATQFFALLVLLSALRFLSEREKRVLPIGSALLLGLAILTRPEAVIFAAVAGLFVLGDVVRGERRPRQLVAWGSALAVVVLPHFLWRLSYYGEPLPNTFHAKVSGLWLEQSTVYLGLFARDHVLWLVAPFVVVLFVRARDAAHRFLGSLVLVHVAYVLYVGGDRFEYRFLTPVLPILYWLLAEGARVAVPKGRGSRPVGVLFALVLVGTAAVPTFLPFQPQHGINSLEKMGALAEWRAEQGRFLRELVDEGLLAGDELLGVRGAGALPYHAGLPTLDLHGLNDLEIARLPVDERGVIAHEKVATEAILRERGVVICETRNDLVFDAIPPWVERPIKRPYFEGPVRCLAVKGRYLVFVTTLDEVEYRERFAHLEIVH